MSSMRPVAKKAALTTITCAVMALSASLLATPAAGRTYAGHCANRLCTRYVHDTPSCWRFHSRTRIARCFIGRAAARYGQSRSQALAIAWRESRLNWRVTNSSSGAAGLFQFMPGTWAHTPYRHQSPYHPKWASLAAMWMWHHGGYAHWAA